MPDEVNPLYLQPGARIGFYEVITLVGQGGFGALYKVQRGSRVFALKLSTFKLADMDDEERTHYLARTKREAGALMQLRHPNVVQVHGFEQWPEIEAGFPYIVMDFVDGLCLYDWRRKHRCSLRQIADVFRKIGLALYEIHRCEIFHRDLKSENILIRDQDAEPIIIDFGLSRPRSAYTVTHVEDIVGSYSSFTPEYCKHAFSTNRKDKKPFVYRPTTDLHAVGYMLYEVISGRPPFDAESKDQIDLLVEIEEKVPTRPALINSNVPESLDAIAMRLLEKEPEKRFQTGSELAAALEEALAHRAASWDLTFEVPPRPHSDGATQDARAKRSKTKDAVSDAGVKIVGAPPEDPKEVNASLPAADSPDQAAGNQTNVATADPVAPPPPRVEQQNLGPSEHGIGATRRHSLTSAIRRFRAVTLPASSSRNVALILGAGGLVIGIFFGAAFISSRKTRTQSEPQTLLSRVARSEPPGGPVEAIFESPHADGPVKAMAEPPRPSNESSPTRDKATAEKRHVSRSAQQVARNQDEANIDAILQARYGRPKVPAKESAPHRTDSVPDGPRWLRRGHRVDTVASTTASGTKKRGVPFGTHLKTRLVTNLDSRTIGDGLVEATLLRPFLKEGQAVLPSKTMLYGQAQRSGDRFTVQFFRLRLPDNTEVTFSGLAFDIDDNKPGLQPTARIAPPVQKSDGLGTKVLKGTASTVLGKLSGDDSVDVVRGAGQTMLSHADPTTGFTASGAILLDSGRDFEVVVKETF